ncbi:MAG: elongation factor G [Candidatus Wallbacteria bacterium HGW-Wallbacteria-1]|jgi:elongation factor G|uniref:Elongation factor G n=1 Tax=Candidatus Wallbacteria bacterium HGW-Wallbacteria-1 TaxID=2013854 RepID=A0A2N1PRZ4_9BACT|nr:MAG: elongation factor G [Candidatus Wallbacteria bacterium HGW-Wallbacteria-1]
MSVIGKNSIPKMRNIGISAHIDSGKTTLTERILYYCDKIHAIHEVRGKDGVGATMDSMELERERGITIASAATNVEWKDHHINIIDTPGHVDFTIEVERALRVLDGAILVLCAVGGVQSQSITVDRQLKRYGVPHLAFVNKCDRTGADPFRVCGQLRDRLGHNAVMMQLPIGLEENFQGIIDLVEMNGIFFRGENGEIREEGPIPDDMMETAQEYHDQLVDAVSLFSDELAEAYLEGNYTVEQVKNAIRKGCIDLKLTPVFVGSAYKNKGVQTLLDAVTRYLPSPLDIKNTALNLDKNEEEVELSGDAGDPTVALAFKLEDGKYGQLTYIRVYQGTVSKGDELFNTRSNKRFKVGRLIRMHANQTEDITTAYAGDIVALFGIECVSGDTFTSTALNYSMNSMYVPQPVISLAVFPKDKTASDRMSKALNRFTKEDPTFNAYVDPESSQTIIQGMGELHLDVYLELMKRDYKVEFETGKPQVAYRESITKTMAFDYTHRKQTGGHGQYARVAGFIEPYADGDFLFNDITKGGVIPSEYIPSCEKGFRTALKKGQLIKFPVVGVKVTIDDGNFHPVDSSDMAFQLASLEAFKETYMKASPEIIEPIMRVSVETPSEFQGGVIGSLNQRRGIIAGSADEGSFTRIDADVPLSEMFFYTTNLRSITQGKAQFSMEFSHYAKVPSTLKDELVKEYLAKKN